MSSSTRLKKHKLTHPLFGHGQSVLRMSDWLHGGKYSQCGYFELEIKIVTVNGQVLSTFCRLSSNSGKEEQCCSKILSYPVFIDLDDSKFSLQFHQHQPINNFFTHWQLSEGKPSADVETSRLLKLMHVGDVDVRIKFLPAILNQLLQVLIQVNNEDVAVNVVR